MAQHLAWICPGSWQAWIPDEGWPGVVPYGFCLSPFQSSAHCWSPVWKLEETGPGYPLADVQLSQTKHQRGIQGLPLSLRLMGADSARFVYKPVYPSIYMLYRMYICWEHARFCVSLLCVMCSTAQSPNLALAGVGLK